MNGWRKYIAAFVGGLFVCAAAHADMVPVSQLDAGYRHTEQPCGQAGSVYTSSSSPFGSFSFAALDSWSVEFLPKANTDISQSSELPSLQLTGGPSSFSLCLSALIGLGLCSSAHCIRKLHFGFIPEWYHDGGPYQIGHSLAIMPNSLCPAPVCCFVQPVHTVEELMPQSRLRTIAALWRKSQFTPDAIASRGPPNMS